MGGLVHCEMRTLVGFLSEHGGDVGTGYTAGRRRGRADNVSEQQYFGM